MKVVGLIFKKSNLKKNSETEKDSEKLPKGKVEDANSVLEDKAKDFKK